jgi:hypothetical protein
MTSQELSHLLNEQLAAGYIDVSELDDTSYVQVFNKLGINPILNILSLSPNGWQADENNGSEIVSLDAQLTMDSTVLGIESTAILHFIFTSLPETDNLYSLQLTIDLPNSWTFSTSFPLLSGPTFDSISIVNSSGSGSILIIVASVNVVADPETYPELWFSGYLDPSSSVFVVLAELFSGNHNPPLAEGRIDFDAATGIALMHIPFAESTITGVFGESGPDFDFSINLFGAVNPDINFYQTGILFVTDILLGDVTVPLTALYNDTSGNCIDLQINSISVNWVSAVDSLLVYFGSNHQLAEYIPQNFPFEELTITGIGFEISLINLELNSSWLGIAVLENTTWNIWPGVLSLSSVKFSCSVQDPLESSQSLYHAELSALAVFGGENGLPLLISGILPDLKLSGTLGEVSYDLVPFMESVFGSSKGLPDDLEITALDFSCNIAANSYQFDLEISGFWEIEFGQDSVLEFEELKISASYDSVTGAQGTLYTKLIVNDSVFNTELDLSAQNIRLAGEWQSDLDSLDYIDIAIAFGMYGLPDLPENLQLNLTEASFELETAGPSASFTLTSANYGSAALIAGKDENGNWGFVFGMLTGLDASLNLTDIDVVGNFVPSGMDTVSVNNLRFIGATQALPLYTSTPELENILGSQINSGLVLSIDLAVGSLFSETFSVRFGGLDDGSAADTPPPPIEIPEGLGDEGDGGNGENTVPTSQFDTPSTLPPSNAAAPGPTSAWISVQRAFGPVHINRIGFRITEDNSLGILLDADVKLAGLTIGLDALEADIPISSPFWPSFSLGGLEVGYTAPGFMLAGGLQKLYGSDPAQYTGELIVQAGSFGASAFGSYTTVNGDPSLFAFLAINVPIGGPPFCVVTGISLGFGYNRRLILPDISNVQTYPLVQAAMGITDPQATINALNQYIVPAENQYWLAAGIRFTSFEMLNAYALLTASFGTQVELALMGEAMLTLPVSMPGETATILAQADMVLLASITPSLGQIAINAQLTSRSFVLDRNAQITGGFAFYFWYGKSAHKGDFVVTLGGYNPHFSKPDYYPSVPQLGLNWKISDLISIKGGLYCALTPAVIMAGGNLSATYQSGDVKAWFTANADFLMRFKPFSFDMIMAVSVGASYKLNLLFTSKTVSVTVGASLHLWGPPFAGSAVVDLKVMSFTINFGAARVQQPSSISWNEFRNSFLPPEPVQENSNVLSLDQNSGGGVTRSLITYSSENGLLGTAPAEALGTFGASLLAGSTVWKIDPGHTSILINFAIPISTYSYRTENTTGDAVNFFSNLGVGPMSIGAGGLKANAYIEIVYSNGVSTNNWLIDFIYDNVPAGLWQNTSNSMTSPALVMNEYTGVRLCVAAYDKLFMNDMVTVPLDVLLYNSAPVPLVGTWSTSFAATSDSFDQYNAMSVVQNTITSSTINTSRSNMLDVLNVQGLTTYNGDEIQLSRYAAQLPELVYSAPQIRYTGETA